MLIGHGQRSWRKTADAVPDAQRADSCSTSMWNDVPWCLDHARAAPGHGISRVSHREARGALSAAAPGMVGGGSLGPQRGRLRANVSGSSSILGRSLRVLSLLHLPWPHGASGRPSWAIERSYTYKSEQSCACYG